MGKSARYYTLMVIPESHGKKTISIRIEKIWISVLLVVVFGLLAFMGFILFTSIVAAKKMHQLYVLRNDNAILMEENERLREVHQKIGHLDSIADYLQFLSTMPQQADPPRGRKGALAEQAMTSEAVSVTMESAATGIEKDNAQRMDESIPAQLPVAGWVTQKFAEDPVTGRVHPGIDIAAAEGVEIKAPAGGTVIDVSKDKDYGKMVAIQHNDTYITRYGHCSVIFVAKNEKVERGQTIALVGNTGRSTAPHLHYEMIKNGKKINPMEVIKTENK